MAIVIKNAQQIEKMRVACNLVKGAFALCHSLIADGITTRELDENVTKFLKSRGAKASFKNYRGFPKSCCISINEEIIHGIPGPKRLRNGDIVSIDIGAFIGGYHGDAARTFAVGEVDGEALHLIAVTRDSFFAGMKFARKGFHLNQVSAAIQEYAESQGFGVVTDYVGHGIGADLHEAPEIPNFRQKKRGPRLQPGMTLAIEPMINMGTPDITTLEDGWTVVTADGKPSAHYENTVLITDGAPEILTLEDVDYGI